MKPKTNSINLFFEELIIRFKNSISESESDLPNTSKNLSFVRELLHELQRYLITYRFDSVQEEILFFKTQKPILLSQYYYFKRKFSLQLYDSFRDGKSRLENYERTLTKMQGYVHKQKDFYQYCLSGASFLDEAYFSRQQKGKIKINSDLHFNTRYDARLAKILANEMIKTYVEKCISGLKSERSKSLNSELIWTGQKIELVELIYALQAVGSFNNASLDVRKIVGSFEIIFNIDLGNYYRTFVGLRMRKNGYTSFLDNMKAKLEQRINEIEDR